MEIKLPDRYLNIQAH